MELKSLYRSKLTTPADAVGRIASGVNLSMGMAMTEPPALLKALADRAAAGKVDDLKVYYCESTQIAGSTILRYELLDRIRGHRDDVSGDRYVAQFKLPIHQFKIGLGPFHDPAIRPLDRQ